MSPEATQEEGRPHRIGRVLAKSAKWLVLTLLGAFLVGIVFSNLSPPRLLSWAVWHVHNLTLTGAPADCGDTSCLAADRVDMAHADNELAPNTNATYIADNIHDGSRDTAWAQRFPAANGKAVIVLKFSTTDQVRLLCLQRGYTKNYITFATNERVRTLTITFPGTQCPANAVSFQDVVADPNVDFADNASVPLNCSTKTVEMRVTGTWPANDHSHDLAISEAMFYSS